MTPICVAAGPRYGRCMPHPAQACACRCRKGGKLCSGVKKRAAAAAGGGRPVTQDSLGDAQALVRGDSGSGESSRVELLLLPVPGLPGLPGWSLKCSSSPAAASSRCMCALLGLHAAPASPCKLPASCVLMTDSLPVLLTCITILLPDHAPLLCLCLAAPRCRPATTRTSSRSGT